MNLKILRNYLPLLIIILLAAFLRLVFLDKVPNAIGGDELTYIINAKAVWLTGSDISGNWNPLSVFLFKYPAYTSPQAELPYLLLAPIVGPFPFSLFTARLAYALLSVLVVFVVYLVTKELFGREVGLISGLVASLNPWLIYIGRTSYEATPMVLFFLIATLILLKARSTKILFSIPFLFAGFYSYIGTKLIFLPFVFILCVYSYYFVNKKKYLREYLIVFFASLFLVLFFVYSITFGAQAESRIGEILLPNNPQIAKEVDEIRKVSIKTPLTNIFENKATIYFRILITKFFKSISADYLFISGDNFYSIIRHGMFYVLDGLFLALGLAAIYTKKRKVFWFLLSLVFISIFPQIFQGIDLRNFVYHLSLMFPFLIIFIAFGIWETVNFIQKKSYFYASSAVLILLYGFLVFNFLNIYFFQWTLRGDFDFHIRLFSRYALLAREGSQTIDVYSPSAPDVFKKYLFYTNSYNEKTVLDVRNIYKSEKFVFDNINFKGCDKTIDPSKSQNLIIYDFNCGSLKKDYSHIAIARIYDGGQSYLIFNDNLCSSFSLKPYPQNIKISDFSIEKMNAQKFCETYITNP